MFFATGLPSWDFVTVSKYARLRKPEEFGHSFNLRPLTET
jgi:hypothetical protein